MESITQSGGNASFYPVDITNQTSVVALHAHILEKYGRLDAAVNNAGMSSTFQPFHVTPVEDLDLMYNLNLKGTFRCMQAQDDVETRQAGRGR